METLTVMETLTKEQVADIMDRKEKFIKAYEDLTREFEMDFAQYPSFVPMASGLFAIRMEADLRDKKYLPIASPVQINTEL